MSFDILSFGIGMLAYVIEFLYDEFKTVLFDGLKRRPNMIVRFTDCIRFVMCNIKTRNVATKSIIFA